MANVGDTTGDLREDVPLKNGSKSSKLCFFNEDCIGGSRFINIAFAVLTFIITLFLLLQIYYGDYQVVPHGSVASDGKECSEIGTTMLKRGGNAIDATIATAFCLAVVCPHTTGLDSHGQILIYNHRDQVGAQIVDFQDVHNQTPYLTKLVIALMYMHKNYGVLPWKLLVNPAVNLAKKGFLVSKMLEHAIVKEKPQYFDSNVVAGQMIAMIPLSQTLEKISNILIEDVYASFLQDNRLKIGIALNFTFDNYNIYVPDTPGIILANTLKLVEELNLTAADVSTPEYLYQIANVTKYQYQKNDVLHIFNEGTSSNIAVMDLNDVYVSFTSGMYKFFGSKIITKQGYFSDVEPTNKIGCSRLPFIIADKFICGRRIVSGSNDVATATQIISTLLIAKQNVTKSIESPRFNMLQDFIIGIEDEHVQRFTNEELQKLEMLENRIQPISEPYFSCNVVEKFKDDLSSHSDSRGGGIASRF